MSTTKDVMHRLHSLYPPALAEIWDSVGFISGSWNSVVQRVLVCVDLTTETLDEAIAIDAQLVIAHHPLFLPRHSVSLTPYKIRLAQRAVTHGIALANAHTNADVARPGVSDALADALEVHATDALQPTSLDTVTGIGRIGHLAEPMTLGEFARKISTQVPGATARVFGDESRMVQRVALCAGAGDSLLDLVRHTDADVYVTSDLRHHPVAEHREAGGCALIDIDHFAAEQLWLPRLARELSDLKDVDVTVSTRSTAAWNRNLAE